MVQRRHAASQLWRKCVNIHATVIVRKIDPSVPYRRWQKFVEEVLNIPLLRVPKDSQCLASVCVRDQVFGVISK
jgi:hypothetical protein